MFNALLKGISGIKEKKDFLSRRMGDGMKIGKLIKPSSLILEASGETGSSVLPVYCFCSALPLMGQQTSFVLKHFFNLSLPEEVIVFLMSPITLFLFILILSPSSLSTYFEMSISISISI